MPGPAWNSLLNALGVSVTDGRRPVRDGANGFDLLSGRLDIGLCNKTSLGLSSRAVWPQETPTPLTRMTSLECQNSNNNDGRENMSTVIFLGSQVIVPYSHQL